MNPNNILIINKLKETLNINDLQKNIESLKKNIILLESQIKNISDFLLVLTETYVIKDSNDAVIKFKII
jgi:hypothetical protein